MRTFTQLTEALTCDPSQEVTQEQLDELGRTLDHIWKNVGIDIAWTKHFLDRVNDARNGRQITVCELARLFMETFRKHAKDIYKKPEQFEAVLTDLKTDINVPFVLSWNRRNNEMEMVAKTVMRKKGFHPGYMNNGVHKVLPQLTVAHTIPDPTKTPISERANETPMKNFDELKEFVGFNTPEVGPIGAPQTVDDVEVGAHNVQDPHVLDLLNGFVGRLADRPYLNPYYALNQLFIKLMSLGISFDLNSIVLSGEVGMLSIPLKQYGGRYGYVDDSGQIGEDPSGMGSRPAHIWDTHVHPHIGNTSPNIGFALTLELRWSKAGGLTNLDAKIVKSELPSATISDEFVSEGFGKTSRPKGFQATPEGKSFLKQTSALNKKHTDLHFAIQKLESEVKAEHKRDSKSPKLKTLRAEIAKLEPQKKAAWDAYHDSVEKWGEAKRRWSVTQHEAPVSEATSLKRNAQDAFGKWQKGDRLKTTPAVSAHMSKKTNTVGLETRERVNAANRMRKLQTARAQIINDLTVAKQKGRSTKTLQKELDANTASLNRLKEEVETSKKKV